MTTFEAEAYRVRELILEQALRAGTAHIGPSLSLVEILVTLYLGVLRDPAAGGDRLLLSKGHAASALYATLAAAGLLDEEELLAGYCQDGGVFPGHPERGLPHVQMSGGSLGHGPAIAVGLALADQLDGSDRRTFCVVGDGELNEGSVWEAVALAAQLRLDALTLVVDANGFQGLGRVEDVLDLEPLATKLEAFGWEAREVDGHDLNALPQAFRPGEGRPVCVVARTVKGRGLARLEGRFRSHYKSFRPHERDELLAELALGRPA